MTDLARYLVRLAGLTALGVSAIAYARGDAWPCVTLAFVAAVALLASIGRDDVAAARLSGDSIPVARPTPRDVR